jgi:hypothetical protein
MVCTSSRWCVSISVGDRAPSRASSILLRGGIRSLAVTMGNALALSTAPSVLVVVLAPSLTELDSLLDVLTVTCGVALLGDVRGAMGTCLLAAPAADCGTKTGAGAGQVGYRPCGGGSGRL